MVRQVSEAGELAETYVCQSIYLLPAWLHLKNFRQKGKRENLDWGQPCCCEYNRRKEELPKCYILKRVCDPAPLRVCFSSIVSRALVAEEFGRQLSPKPFFSISVDSCFTFNIKAWRTRAAKVLIDYLSFNVIWTKIRKVIIYLKWERTQPHFYWVGATSFMCQQNIIPLLCPTWVLMCWLGFNIQFRKWCFEST